MTPIDQLIDELEAATLPLAGLLGVDLQPLLSTRIAEAAPRIVAELSDTAESHSVAADLLWTLHGEAGPPPQWWRSPLGRLCAAAVADSTAEAVTRAKAAEILGVTSGTIQQLLHRGTLDRHPDGGLLMSEVLARLTRLGH